MAGFIKATGNDILYNLINLRQLVFEVTDACNLRCKYCGHLELYEKHETRKGRRLPFHKAKLIIDYLHKLWKQNACDGVNQRVVVSFYGGEPLLNIKLIRAIIDYLTSLDNVGKSFVFAMTTNGMLLDRYMDFLFENKFQLLISLDGDKESHQHRITARGDNSFDRVYGNIKQLQSKYPDYFNQNVGFNSVLHSLSSVEKVYNFVKSEFNKSTKISALNIYNVREDKAKEFNKMYQSVSNSIRQSPACESLEIELFMNNPQIAYIANYIHKESDNVYNNYSDLFFDKKKMSYYPTGTCLPFFKKVFITADGQILPCEKISHKYIQGQVTNKGVEMDFDNIAHTHNKLISKYLNQCKYCARINKCMKCVYQGESFQSKQNKCDEHMCPNEYKLYVEEKLAYLTEHPDLYNKIFSEIAMT